MAGAGSLFGDRFDEEPCGVGDVAALAVVVEVVVAVEVSAAGFLVAEPEVERGGAGVIVVDAESDLVAAAFAGDGFVGADDGGAGALRSPFGGPDFQAVELLEHDQPESIRMITNHDMDSSTPFATILVGQPTPRHAVKPGVLAALEQRITVRYQMKGMTPDETVSHTRHHLEQAGRTTELFTDDAITQIHQAARGKPRMVNNIRTAALIATVGAGKNLVDHASARAAIAEVTATD